MEFKEGIYPFYKPKGISSYDLILKIKRHLPKGQKIGHAGTLDPLARGVLIVGIGKKFTKELNIISRQDKEYIAEIFLGEESETDDSEGKKIKVNFLKKPKKLEVEKTIKKFIGTIWQKPPLFSAIKISGKPAYFYARRNKPVVLKPRPVQVKNIEILKYKWPLLKIKVICGKGTYIRALARDIGRELNVGGYLKSLIRTRVGDFEIKDCLKIK